MANSFLLSTNQIFSLVNSKFYMIGDIGLTRFDVLALVIEYMEYCSQGGVDVADYLYNHWLLDDAVVPKISLFIDSVVEEIKLFCPELIDVLQNNQSLHITQYDKHTVVLAKQV